MSEDRIRDKVRALLAKTKPGSGCTEEEAATAMSLAMAMMQRHGINVSLDDDAEASAPGWGPKTERENYMKWHLELAGAASLLYSCKHFIWTCEDGYKFQFVGRPDNTDAAHTTFLWLVEQVEALYKEHLPPGLSKALRAELRRTFKYACALRIRGRAWQLLERMVTDDKLAIASTGSTALVVKTHHEQLHNEADNLIKERPNTKTLAIRPAKSGVGTAMGFRAGDRVQLNQQVGGPKRLQIGDK